MDWESELRERLSKLETKMDFVANGVKDHLIYWDKQWVKIDLLEEELEVLKSEFSGFKTRRGLIRDIVSPFLLFMSGIFGSVITFLVLYYLQYHFGLK